MSNWREQAACRHEDPDLFFPIGTNGPALLQTRRAKEVCAGCRVRRPCLELALATGQSVGIWGGTTEWERRALSRQAGARRRS